MAQSNNLVQHIRAFFYSKKLIFIKTENTTWHDIAIPLKSSETKKSGSDYFPNYSGGGVKSESASGVLRARRRTNLCHSFFCNHHSSFERANSNQTQEVSYIYTHEVFYVLGGEQICVIHSFSAI